MAVAIRASLEYITAASQNALVEVPEEVNRSKHKRKMLNNPCAEYLSLLEGVQVQQPQPVTRAVAYATNLEKLGFTRRVRTVLHNTNLVATVVSACSGEVIQMSASLQQAKRS